MVSVVETESLNLRQILKLILKVVETIKYKTSNILIVETETQQDQDILSCRD